MRSDADTRRIRGVLFDVDGTLYHARPLRRRVITRLLVLPLRGLSRALRTWRILSSFRRALEDVRHELPGHEPLATVHYRRAGELAGADAGDMRACVEEWMLRRPLPFLRRYRRAGVEEFLELLASRDVRIGFFSDYPVRAKLEALGLGHYASLELCATDPDVNAYKPWPHGFRRACEVWGLEPGEVIYVGDRPEVDAIGAAAAGMRCAIIGVRGREPNPACGFLPVGDFPELGSSLEDLL